MASHSYAQYWFESAQNSRSVNGVTHCYIEVIKEPQRENRPVLLNVPVLVGNVKHHPEMTELSLIVSSIVVVHFLLLAAYMTTGEYMAVCVYKHTNPIHFTDFVVIYEFSENIFLEKNPALLNFWRGVYFYCYGHNHHRSKDDSMWNCFST